MLKEFLVILSILKNFFRLKKPRKMVLKNFWVPLGFMKIFKNFFISFS
jgi:hypothetical protein